MYVIILKANVAYLQCFLSQGRKFKKSDVLAASRKLMFEGTGMLQQGKNSRQLPITVVVLSDILFFLQESNQKYYFFSPEGKV